jgi:MFS family permease
VYALLLMTLCIFLEHYDDTIVFLWLTKQSSFLWGYLMSPIIGGALVDYYGGKRVMAYGVALWSLSTFLSPWAAGRSIWLFLFTRVLLGIAEGVALPSMNNMVSRYPL